MIEEEGTMKPTGSNSFQSRRSPVRLSEDLDNKLASYASVASADGVGSRARAPAAELITRAATAVGVGLMLTAGPASARIVYTPAYHPLRGYSGTSGLGQLDLNHDGIVDFRFSSFGTHNRSSFVKVFAAGDGNAILGKIQGVL